MGGLAGASIRFFGARCVRVSLLVHGVCVYSPARRGEGVGNCREERRIFGVSSAWFRISQTDAGGGTGAAYSRPRGYSCFVRQMPVVAGSVFCHEYLHAPCGWGLGVVLCAAPAFSQRWEVRAGVHYDAVGDLFAGCGSPGATWDLRRWFVCRDLLAPRFLGLSPLTPFFFLRLCCLCGLVAGWGFFRGVCLFFFWFFMVSAG